MGIALSSLRLLRSDENDRAAALRLLRKVRCLSIFSLIVYGGLAALTVYDASERYYESDGQLIYEGGTLALAAFFAADVFTACWVLSSGTLFSAASCFVSNLLTALLCALRELLGLLHSHTTGFSLLFTAVIIASKLLSTYALYIICDRMREGQLQLRPPAAAAHPMLMGSPIATAQPILVGTPIAVAAEHEGQGPTGENRS